MYRRTFLISSPLLLAPVWAACRRSPRRVIGVVPKGAGSIFWQSIYAGAIAAGRDFQVEVFWESPREETDVPRQIELVELMIRRQVDGIVLAPSDRAALVGVVDRAAEAGIPITIVVSPVDTDRYLSYVATDHVAAGGMAARKIARVVGGKGKVAMIKNAPGSVLTEERELGFEAEISAKYPEILIVARHYCLSDRAKALAVTEDILTKHPDANALFCSSEEASTGAMRAIRLRNPDGKVGLVGFGATFGLQQGLEDGVINALVLEDPFLISYAGMKTIVQKLSGLTPPKRIESPARLVSVADLSDPAVQRLINPVAEPLPA